MIITKYFPEANWEDYCKGSFKIGTLQNYRGTEGQNCPTPARMTDVFEGVSLTGYGKDKAYLSSHRAGDGSVWHNASFSGHGFPLIEGYEFNEYVFCASVGRYDRSHHKMMVHGYDYGDGSNYRGNIELTAYAEIDLRKFKKALRHWLLSAKCVTSKFPVSEIIDSRKVIYEDRFEARELSELEEGRRPMTLEEYLRAVFYKPPLFRVENEVRVTVQTTAPVFLQEDAPPLYPCSRRFLRSIVSMGRLDI